MARAEAAAAHCLGDELEGCARQYLVGGDGVVRGVVDVGARQQRLLQVKRRQNRRG